MEYILIEDSPDAPPKADNGNCRICYIKFGPKSIVVKPCKCPKVHTKCIRKWIYKRNFEVSNKCEVCLCEYNPPIKRKYNFNKPTTKVISKILDSESVSNDRLLEYYEFNLAQLINDNIFRNILAECSDDVIKHVIDECINLDCLAENDIRPIHELCMYSTPVIIKYIANKDINLECKTSNGTRPIHLVCIHSTPKMIKYLIEKGVDLECTMNKKTKPVHLICKHSTPTIIKYIIDKDVDLLSKDEFRTLPVNYIEQRNISTMKTYVESKMEIQRELKRNKGGVKNCWHFLTA